METGNWWQLSAGKIEIVVVVVVVVVFPHGLFFLLIHLLLSRLFLVLLALDWL